MHLIALLVACTAHGFSLSRIEQRKTPAVRADRFFNAPRGIVLHPHSCALLVSDTSCIRRVTSGILHHMTRFACLLDRFVDSSVALGCCTRVQMA
jgi:hypothetical protein